MVRRRALLSVSSEHMAIPALFGPLLSFGTIHIAYVVAILELRSLQLQELSRVTVSRVDIRTSSCFLEVL